MAKKSRLNYGLIEKLIDDTKNDKITWNPILSGKYSNVVQQFPGKVNGAYYCKSKNGYAILAHYKYPNINMDYDVEYEVNEVGIGLSRNEDLSDIVILDDDELLVMDYGVQLLRLYKLIQRKVNDIDGLISEFLEDE